MALSKIDIANMLTGIAPVANGGTGLASGTTDQFLKFTGSTTLASAADNAGAKLVLQVKNDGSQDMSDNTTTKIDLGTEVIDTASAFSASKWTPPNGHYIIMMDYYGYPVGAAARGFAQYIYKNGGSTANFPMYSNSSAQYFGNSDNNGRSSVWYLEQTTATDYYEWYVYNNTDSVTWKSTRLQVQIFKDESL